MAEAKLEEKKDNEAEAEAKLEEQKTKGEPEAEAKPEEKKDSEAEAEAKLEEKKMKSEAKPEEKKDSEADAEAKLEEKKKSEPEAEAKLEEKATKAPAKPRVEALKLSLDDELAVQMAVDNWKVEDLRPEFRDHFLKVQLEGVGVCSRCRYTYGCLRCDENKAWNYWVRQELGFQGSVAKKAKAKGAKQ